MDISGWVSSLWSQLGDLMNTALTYVLMCLPDSPFVMLAKDTTIYKYLQYINYFIPISFMIATLQSWVVAVGIFYLWQVLLRWIKAIE